jgi:hypothetical protein
MHLRTSGAAMFVTVDCLMGPTVIVHIETRHLNM